MQTIIYTDLDGTFIDFEDYSYEFLIPTVEKLKQKNIPIIFCSSKTRVEQEVYLKAFDLNYPIIVENGSAIFIPNNFFDFEIPNAKSYGEYQLLELGVPFEKIRQAIETSRAESGSDVKGYADLPLEEVARIIKLPLEAAQRAGTREFSETLIKGDKTNKAFQQFKLGLEKYDLQCVSGGKFHTVMGTQSDKGKAVIQLTALFKQKYNKVETIGLGDSANDAPLLASVDSPFLVQKPKPQPHWQDIDSPNLTKVDGVGPKGWKMVMEDILELV